MNPIDALRASGLNPVVIDENTDIEEVVNAKRETNEEFIVRIMNWCPHGPIIQAFIIDALGRSADHFSQHRIPDGGFIHPDMWQETAQWLKEELEKKYG